MLINLRYFIIILVDPTWSEKEHSRKKEWQSVDNKNDRRKHRYDNNEPRQAQRPSKHSNISEHKSAPAEKGTLLR